MRIDEAAVPPGVWEDLGLVAAGGVTVMLRWADGVLACLLLAFAVPAGAQTPGPVLPVASSRFEPWRAALPLDPGADPAASRLDLLSRNRRQRALLGGAIGAAAGVVFCTVVSTLADDSADGGVSFCPLDSYLLIGGLGFVLGAAIGWVT